MLHVERIINQLMTSNCYIVVDEGAKHCICIDPASEKSEREIAYIEQRGLSMDYIILTHEHTDHTWGVNSLVDRFHPQVICSETCKQNLGMEFQAYFQLYFDDTEYTYNVCNVDKTTEELGGRMRWQGHEVKFVPAPGHSLGSICVDIDGWLFTGDAVMLSKPYINKRNGSKELFFESVKKVMSMYSDDTLIYPGHGESFPLYSIYLKPDDKQ